jgi:hypothetical protein
VSVEAATGQSLLRRWLTRGVASIGAASLAAAWMLLSLLATWLIRPARR